MLEIISTWQFWALVIDPDLCLILAFGVSDSM